MIKDDQWAENHDHDIVQPPLSSFRGIIRQIPIIITINQRKLSTIMTFIPPVATASPAPLMFAHVACHVLTPSILFNRDVAFGAPLEFLVNRPVLQDVVLLLAACQILVPRN